MLQASDAWEICDGQYSGVYINVEIPEPNQRIIWQIIEALCQKIDDVREDC